MPKQVHQTPYLASKGETPLRGGGLAGRLSITVHISEQTPNPYAISILALRVSFAKAWFNYRALQSLRSQFVEAPAPAGGRPALNAEIKRETIEQPKRVSGRSFALVVTRKRPSLNRAFVKRRVPSHGFAGMRGIRGAKTVEAGSVDGVEIVNVTSTWICLQTPRD